MGLESGDDARIGRVPVHPGPDDPERRGRGPPGRPPVYVRMRGREHLSDAELLRRAVGRLDESQQRVMTLERTVSELELERDEARNAYRKREGRMAQGDRRAR